MSLTLRFNGSTPQTITAADQINTVFTGVVNPNETFSFVGSIPNDKFVGPIVAMTVNGAANATIPSNCGTVFTGNVYGSFTIVAALSKTGGALCCSAANMEDVPPVITGCPSNVTISLPAGSCSTTGGWTLPSATDNCTLATFDGSHTPTDLLNIGVTAVTYTAIDNYGNSSTCSFTVTVVDNLAPVISSCPPDIIVEAESSCGTVVSWTPPTATDNCSSTLTASHPPGSTFISGTTTVTYTASDPSGNSTTCSFNVTVKDATLPLISGCPVDITVVATTCNTVVVWTPPTVSDNCSATLSESHAPGSSFLLGTTTVTYVATDVAGNSSTCSFKVTVTDSPPVITGCPNDITLTVAGCEAPVVWTPPVADDNCLQGFTSSHQPGSIFPLGTTTITYTATDVANNSTTCSFKVTVRTDEAPAITGCPSNITLHTFEDALAVSWNVPQATPLCGILSAVASHEPGTQFSIGTTEVSYQFTDGTGNRSVCSFSVEVIKDDITFEVSKAVTPNGDGINDTWLLQNIEKFKDNTVLVVDRWGNRIFHTSGYDNDVVHWNGNGPGGGKVPVGTYFYIIEIRVGESIVRDSGSIEVVY